MQNDASMFYNDMQTELLSPTISRPTRIASSPCSLIHNIFVKNLNNFKSGSFTIDITDHILIFIEYDYNFSTDKQTRFRHINQSTTNSLCHKFGLIVTSQIKNEIDINETLIKLDKKILKRYNKCYPIKTKFISSKDQFKPMIN